MGGNIRSRTHGLLQCATHSMAAASSKVKGSECPRWKSQPFPHLILEVASHHFYRILFIKISQLSLVHSPGQGVGGGYTTARVPGGGDQGVLFEAAHHS